MTDWKKAYSASAPAELDKESSPTTVYQRRNIKMVTEEKDGVPMVHYEYEERTMSHEEYTAMTDSNLKSTIEYVAVMAGVELEGVL